MNLNEVHEVVKNVANITGGTIFNKEYLNTDRYLYLFLNDVSEDLDLLITFLNQNTKVHPILVITQEKKYEIDDELVLESSVFNHLKDNCQAVQGDFLLQIVNGKVAQKRLISKNAL